MAKPEKPGFKEAQRAQQSLLDIDVVRDVAVSFLFHGFSTALREGRAINKVTKVQASGLH